MISNWDELVVSQPLDFSITSSVHCRAKTNSLSKMFFSPQSRRDEMFIAACHWIFRSSFRSEIIFQLCVQPAFENMSLLKELALVLSLGAINIALLRS